MLLCQVALRCLVLRISVPSLTLCCSVHLIIKDSILELDFMALSSLSWSSSSSSSVPALLGPPAVPSGAAEPAVTRGGMVVWRKPSEQRERDRKNNYSRRNKKREEGERERENCRCSTAKVMQRTFIKKRRRKKKESKGTTCRQMCPDGLADMTERSVWRRGPWGGGSLHRLPRTSSCGRSRSRLRCVRDAESFMGLYEGLLNCLV